MQRKEKTNDQTLKYSVVSAVTQLSAGYHGITCGSTYPHRGCWRATPFTPSFFHKRLSHCIASGKADFIQHEVILFRMLDGC